MNKYYMYSSLQGFNNDFEEICQTQKTYAVPDENLRDQLRQENINLVVQSYRSFREK